MKEIMPEAAEWWIGLGKELEFDIETSESFEEEA